MKLFWNYEMRWLLALIPFFLPGPAQAQAARIFLDGTFQDWQDLAPAHTDPSGDAAANAVDFGRVWVSNDAQFFFLRIEFGVDMLLQELNDVRLYLDTDDDPSTGRPFHGLGAELTWRFGQRSGFFVAGGVSRVVSHQSGLTGYDIAYAPTVSATTFEIAIARDALPDGQTALFPGATLRFALEDPDGDLLPDAPGGIAYTFDDVTPLPPLPLVPLGKERAGDLRILSYNVARDALFNPSRSGAFARLLQAVRPDIIGFQEIYNHTAQQTAAAVEAALPLPAGQDWHAARVDPDLIVVSRYPVRQSHVIPGGNQGDRNAAFLLDLQARWDTDVLFFVAHPPCCGNNAARQVDVDALMAFLRDAQTEGGQLDLAADTPVIIVGDMNLVGPVVQLETLLQGAIVNTNRFGPAFAPDWDGTALADLLPRHVALPMTFTFYSEGSAFPPGRLDYIIYTDSVLEPGNSFVLFTPAMPADSLAAYGLEAADATLASDHLPLVGDFRLASTTPVEAAPDLTTGLSLGQNHPNPFHQSTDIAYAVGVGGPVRLVVYDVLGREVARLVDGIMPTGRYQARFDAGTLPNGVYLYRIERGSFVQTKTMTLLR